MAGDKHIEFDVEGLGRALLGVQRAQAGASSDVIDLLDDLRQRGEHYIRLYAPAYNGELMRRIASSYPRLSVGAHGTEYEASAGVRAGGDRHPLYVHGGTGIYKLGALAGTRLRVPGGPGFYIRNRNPSKPLTFQKRGEPRRFRMWVRGQKANPFVHHAYQQLVPYAAAKVRRLFGRRESEGI